MMGRRLSPMMKFFAVAVVLAVLALGALNIWLKKHALELYEASTRGALEKAGLELLTQETPSGTLVYWQGGEGPDLVLVHGAGDQAGAWANAVPELLRDYRLSIPDLPGHGESSPLDGDLAFSTVVAGLTSFLDERQAPFVLIGHSMGAWLATLYAREHPERLERLVLVNGGAVQGEPSEITLLPKNREEARAAMAALRDSGSPQTPDVVLDAIVKRAEDGPLARLMRDLPDLQEHILTDDQLAEIEVPVELLWGESDQLMTLNYAERLTRALPNSRLTRLPRCGHLPVNECPEIWLEAFGDVMQQAPPQHPPESQPSGEATDDPR